MTIGMSYGLLGVFGWLLLNMGVAIVYAPTLMRLTSDDYTMRVIVWTDTGQTLVYFSFI